MRENPRRNTCSSRECWHRTRSRNSGRTPIWRCVYTAVNAPSAPAIPLIIMWSHSHHSLLAVWKDGQFILTVTCFIVRSSSSYQKRWRILPSSPWQHHLAYDDDGDDDDDDDVLVTFSPCPRASSYTRCPPPLRSGPPLLHSLSSTPSIRPSAPALRLGHDRGGVAGAGIFLVNFLHESLVLGFRFPRWRQELLGVRGVVRHIGPSGTRRC